MNKAFAVISGFVSGMFSVMVMTGYVQFITAAIILIAYQGRTTNNSITVSVVVMLAPIVYSIIMIELSNLLIRRTSSDLFRIGAVIFNLISTGYVILSVLLGSVSILIKKDFGSNWYTYLNIPKPSFNQQLIIIMFIIVVLFSYLNFTTKRFRKIIPAIKNK